MQGSVLILRFLLLGSAVSISNAALGQIDAPVAMTEKSGCAHDTCAWAPSLKHRIFTAGDLTYTVEMYQKEETGGDFVMRRAGNELLRARLDGLSASVSVVWSADKKNFAITWSLGGENGGFHVRAFHVEGDLITEFPATRAALDDFDERHGCEARGNNIQAHSWLPDSRTLVLVLSNYPSADCGRDHGHTEAYLVDAPRGKIVQRWNLKKLNEYMAAHPE